MVMIKYIFQVGNEVLFCMFQNVYKFELNSYFNPFDTTGSSFVNRNIIEHRQDKQC